MSDVNKLADRLCAAAVREYENKANQAANRFISELKLVPHELEIELEGGQKVRLASIIFKIKEAARKAQIQKIHDNAILDFHEKYAEIARFMDQE